MYNLILDHFPRYFWKVRIHWPIKAGIRKQPSFCPVRESATNLFAQEAHGRNTGDEMEGREEG